MYLTLYGVMSWHDDMGAIHWIIVNSHVNELYLLCLRISILTILWFSTVLYLYYICVSLVYYATLMIVVDPLRMNNDSDWCNNAVMVNITYDCEGFWENEYGNSLSCFVYMLLPITRILYLTGPVGIACIGGRSLTPLLRKGKGESLTYLQYYVQHILYYYMPWFAESF